MWNKLWAARPATALIALLAFVAPVAMPTLAAARTLLTIADGPVLVLRGTQRLTGAEGMALADADIVRTTAATRVARIEWADGRVLDLGPATDVMLASERATARSADLAGSAAVLARGWAKLAAGAAGAARLAAPGVVAQADARGIVLLHAADDGALVAFAESRAATIAPRGAGDPASLREGQAWARASAAAAGAVVARRAALGEVPRALTDALPRRAARFAERDLPAGAAEPLDADDLEAWRRAEPALLALLHPRPVRAAATKTASTAPRAVFAAHRTPRPKVRGVKPAPVVVPGLPRPPGGGEPDPSVPALGGSPRLAAEGIGAAALPAIVAPPALPALLPTTPVAAAAPAIRKRY
ncbi:MAG TPA: hypothetical protein VFQ20_04655 [Burkholderiaceae bacterium]|nr:hypothetical protein [Burkholderiaceae bacterium]